MATSEITVSQFDKIHSSGSAVVRYHKSHENKVVLTADSNLLEYVEIVTKGSTLNIGKKRGYSVSFTRWTVDVYSPALTGISISGSGRFSSTEKITANRFTSSVSGSGRIEGAIESENFTADISGSGRITVSGNSNISDITISGSGRFNGTNFPVRRATVRVSGSGNADIWATDNLNANVSGSGSIRYRGNPIVISIVTGSGQVKRL